MHSKSVNIMALNVCWLKGKSSVCLHFELLYFLKYDVLSEYLTPFWFAMLLNEYEIEFMFSIFRNLGNVHIRGPHIVMSRTDAQNGLDFPLIQLYVAIKIFRLVHS
jgi:hypothetical protein